eukprot:NODE_516_length_1654_cov_30.278505_g428_i0.p3 GENE.NODE_516_length_1654_cov_30.278505_g428_i0~~NODE_516_length_1654_cov_30.278505_g428_i0.p3  ORF type:complete len:146 (-),score=47.91 NODE_516_length_1654_cov_30.278505_g428_i0:122-559(-)
MSQADALCMLGLQLERPTLCSDEIYRDSKEAFYQRHVAEVGLEDEGVVVYDVFCAVPTDLSEWMYSLEQNEQHDPLRLYRMGQSSHRMEKYSDAAEHFEEFLEEHPEDVPARRLHRLCRARTSPGMDYMRYNKHGWDLRIPDESF